MTYLALLAWPAFAFFDLTEAKLLTISFCRGSGSVAAVTAAVAMGSGLDEEGGLESTRSPGSGGKPFDSFSGTFWVGGEAMEAGVMSFAAAAGSENTASLSKDRISAIFHKVRNELTADFFSEQTVRSVMMITAVMKAYQ